MTDLVIDLPESEGMTAIAVFVDRLTKMVHFVLYKKDTTAQQYARLFIDHVFKLHGLPEVIISDHDPKFLSKFWDELVAHLGTDLWFSTAFHPQCKTCCYVHGTCAWSFDVRRTPRLDSLHTHARTRLKRREMVKLAYNVDPGKRHQHYAD